MTKKIIAMVAATVVPLAFGCSTDSQRQAEDQRVDPAQPAFAQQGDMYGQGGQEQWSQQRQSGQFTQIRSQHDLLTTVQRLSRDMRRNHLQVLDTVAYTKRSRQQHARAAEHEGQHHAQQQEGQQMGASHAQAQAGGQQQAQMGHGIGDVRLIVFRNQDYEDRLIDSLGATALLNVPRQIVAYERGDQVFVAFATPEGEPEIPGTHKTTQLLEQVARSAAGHPQAANRAQPQGEHQGYGQQAGRTQG